VEVAVGASGEGGGFAFGSAGLDVTTLDEHDSCLLDPPPRPSGEIFDSIGFTIIKYLRQPV